MSLGQHFEYRVRDRLRACGYEVIRAAASKTCVDLVAIRERVLLVQCKRGSIPRTVEWNALYDLAECSGCIPVLASMPGRTGIRFYQLAERKVGTPGVRSPLIPFEVSPMGEIHAAGVGVSNSKLGGRPRSTETWLMAAL